RGSAMYEGFRRFDIQTSDHEVKIRGAVGGSGPPVLLLHGNPLSHYHWRFVAPRLARDFTVVATDLRGYGDSGKPRGLPDHSNYSFRRMAQDQVDVMRELGFERFMVAGHDRGARTAYRMALGSSGRGAEALRHRHPADPSRVDARHARVGAQQLSLVVHGAALRFPGAIAGRQGGVLHPPQARLAGAWQGRLHRGCDPRVRALLHAREHPRRVRGLS